MHRLAPRLLPLLLLGCADEPTWFETCGDPACGGYDGPTEGIPACTGELAGGACPAVGEQCDLQDDCNTFLVCADEDPQDGGGCPISLAVHKKQVAYLDEAAVRRAADAALDIRLATWRYTWEDDAGRPHLGFVIDDQPPGSPAVRPDGAHVDLYGTASLALAAVQAQRAELDALRAEVAALRAEVAAAGTCAP